MSREVATSGSVRLRITFTKAEKDLLHRLQRIATSENRTVAELARIFILEGMSICQIEHAPPGLPAAAEGGNVVNLAEWQGRGGEK